jgi:signal recognition particle receptor subunit beta
MRVERNYYEVLGVDRNVDLEGLKEAKKRKVLDTHPDKNPGKNSSAEFRLVIKAYQVLSNPEERALHNRSLENPANVQSPSPSSPTFFRAARAEAEINNEYDFLYKFVFIGAAHNSMKSKVISAMTIDSLRSGNTVGVDFRIKKLSVENMGVVKEQLWDTAGQERFAMGKIQLKGAAGIVIVVDAANEITLHDAKNQLSDLKVKGLLEDMIISLIVINNDPTLRACGDEDIDSFLKEFSISQRIEINLKKPDESLLDHFLVNLVTEAYKKEAKLPTDLLLAGTANDEDDQIVKEDDSKCCVM